MRKGQDDDFDWGRADRSHRVRYPAGMTSTERLPGGWYRADRERPPRHRYALGESPAAARRCLDAGLAWDRLLQLLGLGPEGED